MRMHRLPLKVLQLLTVGMLFFPGVARAGGDPLLGVSPWDFQPQNRAAVAIAIRNAEEGSQIGGNGGGTTIVCGGAAGAQGTQASGSSSSATANSSCVIINDSDGATANVGLSSTGNQSSSASSQASNASIDEVAAALGLPPTQ